MSGTEWEGRIRIEITDRHGQYIINKLARVYYWGFPTQKQKKAKA